MSSAELDQRRRDGLCAMCGEPLTEQEKSLEGVGGSYVRCDECVREIQRGRLDYGTRSAGSVSGTRQSVSIRHCEAELHPDCTGIGVHRHHRKLRRHRDETSANLIWLCAFCHNAVHGAPEEAYRRGLLLRSWETPSDVPVTVDL